MDAQNNKSCGNSSTNHHISHAKLRFIPDFHIAGNKSVDVSCVTCRVTVVPEASGPINSVDAELIPPTSRDATTINL
jgi:hypothetical protein